MKGEQREVSRTELLEQIEQQTRKVHTRSLDLSFSEILSMYKSGDLIIRPDYQRTFRWTVVQRSLFVESLILEIPIPPIYFAETEDANSFELVDGLQRVSSILNLFGSLPKEIIESTRRYEEIITQEDETDEEEFIEDDHSVEEKVEQSELDDNLGQSDKKHLRLEGCEIIKSLNGRNFNELPLATQRHLRYASIRVEIIRKDSPSDIKYFLFKRLNRGGSLLSDQEVRNSIVRMGNEKIIDFIKQTSRDTNFQSCIKKLSKAKFEQKYDEELVLRYFAFKNYREKYVHYVDSFLDEYIEGIAGLTDNQLPFDYENEKLVFEKSFNVLNKALGASAFSARVDKKDKISYFSGFRSTLFEAITLGVLDLLPDLNSENDTQMRRLEEAVLKIKTDPKFKKMITGGGKNYSKKLEERIGFVKNNLNFVNIDN